MRKFLLAIIFGLFGVAVSAQPIKVACIGNSITFGAGIANQAMNSYPAQLGYALGSGYEVRNFGVSATTLMSKGNYPYISTKEYKASLEYNPDIVVIKLGTNDSKDFNRGLLKENFKNDYQSLINSYKALPGKPRIILMNPVRCYQSEGDFKEASQVYQSTIIPLIEQLSYENSLEIIDLYHLFGDKWDGALLPDKLHPSALGATAMAQRICAQIEREGTGFKLNIASTAEFNFHGYKGYKMGANMIVEPRRTAQGNPWVIRARFWGHEPQTDIALLERGFHIAYCDVADLFGSPRAIKRYDKFYGEMVAAGLNKKVVLEAMSRGGLIAMNWAARNAAKVAAIYADAPVLDFKSWPMGLGTGDGSPEDTETLLKEYGFADVEQAKRWNKNPVDQIKQLSKIPILLVVGDADRVVPVSENSAIFEKNIPGIKVIHKPGIGHHPHSLFNPQPIVNFILKATDQWQNPCIKAVPGSEYRSGAGWIEGNDWHKVSQEISEILKSRQVDLLLIGNSITQGFQGSRKIVTHAPGKAAMDAVSKSWESAGISGDRTQNVLWRVQNEGYGACKPKVVIVTIGVNNIVSGGDSAPDCAQGILAVIEAAALEFPDSKIYTFGLLPVGLNPTDGARVKHDQIHAILAKSKFSSNVTYSNLAPRFTDKDGKLNTSYYSGDHLHLTGKGYEKWASIIAELSSL